MLHLAVMFYSLVGTTLAGSMVIIALTLGYDTLHPILIAAGMGLVAALPAAFFVAKQIQDV